MTVCWHASFSQRATWPPWGSPPSAHMAAVGATPSGAVTAEDARDLQSWTGHGWRRLRRRVLVPNQ